MSYDIELRAKGAIPTAYGSDIATATIGAISAAERAKHEQTAKALLAIDPKLETFMSESATELSDVEGGTGIQISLFANEGGMSIPFWHEGNAGEVLVRVGEFLRVLHDVGGYAAYDPQTGKDLTPENGFSIDQTAYSFGVSGSTRASGKPWWKFW